MSKLTPISEIDFEAVSKTIASYKKKDYPCNILYHNDLFLILVKHNIAQDEEAIPWDVYEERHKQNEKILTNVVDILISTGILTRRNGYSYRVNNV